MVLMVGVLTDMNLMKTVELLEISVNHWFPSDVHSLPASALLNNSMCLFLQLPPVWYMLHIL